MNYRKAKKICHPGALLTVEGTSNVFMSLGLIPGTRQVDSFNGFDIKAGVPVRRSDGKCRPATKKETDAYWQCMRTVCGRPKKPISIKYIELGELKEALDKALTEDIEQCIQQTLNIPSNVKDALFKPISEEQEKTMVIELTKDTMCAHDEHEISNYPRPWFKAKPKLPKGTMLEVKKVWSNFYGTYYRCETPDGEYDIPVENAKTILKEGDKP